MTPQTLQVIQRRFDGDARAKAVGLYSLILSVGVLVGQLVGGVIVTTAGWRWALRSTSRRAARCSSPRTAR